MKLVHAIGFQLKKILISSGSSALKYKKRPHSENPHFYSTLFKKIMARKKKVLKLWPLESLFKRQLQKNREKYLVFLHDLSLLSSRAAKLHTRTFWNKSFHLKNINNKYKTSVLSILFECELKACISHSLCGEGGGKINERC